MENLYADIAARTGGDIYIGVVGPVRTGKSTFIKRFMEQLVIPNIEDPYRRERAQDELPQSGSGKTIMTSEPKFVPEEAVEICPDATSRLRVRMIDSVGYMVRGAVGATEDGQPRMVSTPWYDHEIPMTEAAELGTKKVMLEHCTIGLVITTDGTVTDIPRADYEDAERRAIEDMKQTGKPFLTLINTREPGSEAAIALKEQLKQRHGVNAWITDCQSLDKEGISALLRELLYAFPMARLEVYMPGWIRSLEYTHPLKRRLYTALKQQAGQLQTLAEVSRLTEGMGSLEEIGECSVRSVDLGTGAVSCNIRFPDGLYYSVLSEQAGMDIESDAQLVELLSDYNRLRREHEKLADALASVKATGFGVVMPDAEDMTLEPPELMQKNGTFGLKLKAGASAIHMIRVDIDTQITPMVGNEQQSRELMNHLTDQEPQSLWNSNIFGKTVYDLVREGLTGKLMRTPEEIRDRFRGTLTRIVNEGATGLVCLIL